MSIQKKKVALSDVLQDVKDSDVAVMLDDKINLTINGKSMDGLSPEGVDIPELREDKIDYSKYKDLTKFFIHGLIDFSTFISRDVPDKFKKKDTDKQELHSSQQGVKAYKICINLLENELKTGKSGYVEPEDFNHLHQWYVNGIIDFMGITMSDIPEQLSNKGDNKYIIKSAVRAFREVRKQLLDNIKEMVNVK